MAKSTRAHRHRPLRSSPRDGAFLRTFVGVFAGLLLALAALVWVTDPLASFGTGLVPPIVSADRDYKATLYRARRPSPEVVLLGSSRVKTIRPQCVTALTGRPAFNFGVNAGTAEDFLAIFRFMRAEPGFKVREVLLGAEPEAFAGDGRPGRALAQSRALASFVSPAPTDPDRIWSDLLSAASLSAALRSVWHHGFDRQALPLESLHPDGLQARPLWDDQIRSGRFHRYTEVLASSRAIRGRYTGDVHLSTGRVAQLRQLLTEARNAGVRVTAFVPPVHPALSRDAAGTSFERLTEDMVAVLRAAERAGLLHYVETRSLTDFAGDSTLYYDAIHMTSGNADKLLAAVYPSPGRCAVQ
jgi:hypothetical protein